jgi:hypothetical protein
VSRSRTSIHSEVGRLSQAQLKNVALQQQITDLQSGVGGTQSVPNSAAPTSPAAFGPGIYQVGIDMPIGVYRTTDVDCYWAKLHSSNPDDSYDFGYGVGQVTVDSAWFRIDITQSARYNRCVFTRVGSR